MLVVSLDPNYIIYIDTIVLPMIACCLPKGGYYLLWLKEALSSKDWYTSLEGSIW